jgi:hypothetical protein
MDKNMKDPNKPRLWIENVITEDKRKTGIDTVPPVRPVTNTSEAAAQMMNDPDTREELLASLKGRKKPK